MHTHTRGRKAALTVLAALAMTGAAACSSNDDDDSSGSGSDTTDTTAAPAEDVFGEPNPATGEPITIGFVTDGANASFGSDEGRIATFEATVDYVNEYLGGVNGHPLEIEHCSTEATPAGGTQCAVELTGAGVDAVLVPASAQDGAIFEGLADSGIPYFTDTSATGPILTTAGAAFVMTNPLSAIAVPGLTAQEDGLSKVGFVIIDVPAATGPITQLATPIYANLGIELQITAIAPSVADQTPQLQEAISGGSELFSLSGTDDFNIAAYNGLRQLGFDGPILLGDPPETVLEALSTFDGLISGGTQTTDPADPDVQLYNAIIADAGIDEADGDTLAFATVLGFVRALTGATDAVDAATITAGLSAMPVTDIPLGAGITFQCGTAPVSYVPNICSVNTLQWTFDADGVPQDIHVVDIPDGTLDLG